MSIAVIMSGCGAGAREAQHMGFGNVNMAVELDRDDVVVMRKVDAESSVTNYVFGIVSVVDGDKLQILGIPFFKDKVTVQDGRIFGDKTYNRAYYKALEANPDADFVFEKSKNVEIEGFWPFIGTRSVTVSGKAVQLKSDN